MEKSSTSGRVDKNVLKRYSGTYRTYIDGFEGLMDIQFDEASSKFSGSIKFFKWGNEVYEEMKDLRINKNKLYFIRSVSSREEQKKYGSTRYFIQKFYGEFFIQGKEIRGQYEESGTESLWRATKNN